jgi:hypothetical protein
MTEGNSDMPEIPDVVSGQPVASNWGNDIRDRTIQRYADSTERDLLTPFPVAGDMAFLEDTGAVEVFDGVAWDRLRPLSNTAGLVRTFWQTQIQVATTQGQVAILDVDISAAGITNWAKVNVSVIGFASNAQSTQRFWSVWGFSLTSLSLRNVPGQSNPISGTAFGRLQLTEYW